LTHRAVAAQAGVSHARVVYHYASVAELRHAALAAAEDRIVDRLGELMGQPGDAPGTMEPALVPQVAAQLAVHMVTDLRDETTTLYTLMAEATRDEELRTAVSAMSSRIADLMEPLSGSRELATMAGAALLGIILVAMSRGLDRDPEAVRTQAMALVEHFDPHVPQQRGAREASTANQEAGH